MYMSFTEESSRNIQDAFQMASEDQPAGEARIGELETTALSGLVEQLAGVDEEGEVVDSWLETLSDTDAENWKVFTLDVVVNGRKAHFLMRLLPNAPGVWSASISCQFQLPGQEYHYLVGGGSDVFEHEDPRVVVQMMFNCLKDGVTCPTCGRLLVDDSKQYCGNCTRHWNNAPCKRCGKHVGELNKDGVHEPCAKKRRLN